MRPTRLPPPRTKMRYSECSAGGVLVGLQVDRCTVRRDASWGSARVGIRMLREASTPVATATFAGGTVRGRTSGVESGTGITASGIPRKAFSARWEVDHAKS